MTISDQQLILGALDSLAVALAEHVHCWTEGEREIYEQAVAILQTPTLYGYDNGITCSCPSFRIIFKRP